VGDIWTSERRNAIGFMKTRIYVPLTREIVTSENLTGTNLIVDERIILKFILEDVTSSARFNIFRISIFRWIHVSS
jgi:hypothetical protein